MAQDGPRRLNWVGLPLIAEVARLLRREVTQRVVGIVRPETILAGQRRPGQGKWDCSPRRQQGAGCPRTAAALASGGPGLRNTTRVASGDPRMWADVCLQNRERDLGPLARQAHTLHRNLADGSEAERLAWLGSAKAVRDHRLR